MSVAANIDRVRDRIARACDKAGRAPDEITLVAVAKGHPPATVMEAREAGVADIGENRAQELHEKVGVLGADAVRWHFVGPIQRNKVRYLDPAVLVHSVDRIAEAEALAGRGGRCRDVLVEVNVAGEQQKDGVPPDQVPHLLERLHDMADIRVRGLMMMAPKAQNPEDVRWVFAEMRRLRDRLRDEAGDLEELSMGMSDDFEVAIEEGSTLVRIGRAIFREE